MGNLWISPVATRQRLQALQRFAQLRRRLRRTRSSRALDERAFGAAMGACESWVRRGQGRGWE